jgi:uncharacterized protein YegP (UPF0339 family)
MNKPTFEIHMDSFGKYRFRVRATNDKIVAIGEGCRTKTDCINGIRDVKETVKEYYDAEIKDFTSGETTLILDQPKFSAEKGSTVTFSGRLFGNAVGDGVDKAEVTIYESDGALLKDEHLVSGNTDILGEFNIDWVAKKMDWWDNSVEIYAKFEGASFLKPSCSKKQVISISENP